MLRKKCPKCNNKVSRKYDFCPFCSYNLKKNIQRDYGFLGKYDNDMMSMPINNSMIEKLFGTAMKMFEKQMKEIKPKEKFISEPESNLNVQFYVNGKRIDLSPNPVKKQKIIKTLTKEQENKLSKLPKKEPKSKVRRLSGKIIYELEVPGVKDINDIIINQLENSIEIKAIAEKKVYAKILNINLPIIRYGLLKDNLIVELKSD